MASPKPEVRSEENANNTAVVRFARPRFPPLPIDISERNKIQMPGSESDEYRGRLTT